ncbi:acyltransferase family protein [Brevundimonas aveniformis]|uniref:acyltransferase family protein n=1 Tax=Brevundimonas aveniformis TaxID=370977 RepID=UPI002493A875|nr:acyltransferase [Brevundimonas aveniformis]
MSPSSLAQPTGKGEGAGALDLLRFLAAAFIVLYHFGSNAPVDLTAAYPMLDRGWLATDFFIIVSGYVLGRAYGDSLDGLKTHPLSFLTRRLMRIWPPHLIVLGGLAILLAVAGLLGIPSDSPERFQTSDLIYQALLIHAWGVTDQPSWNEPSWTLSALIVCYALFPLIWLLTRRVMGRGWALILGFGLVILAAWLSQRILGTSLYNLAFHHGVVRALPFFILGALLARFAQGRSVSSPVALASCLAALGAVVAIQATPMSEFSALASIVALATLVVGADNLGLRRTRAIRTLGNVSFALFLTHAVVGTVWFSGLDALQIRVGWWAWIGALVVVLTAAGLFHLLIDKPIQTWLRGLMKRAPAKPSSPVAQPS